MSDQDDYITPSSYDPDIYSSNRNSYQRYRYYVNTRTGEKVSSFNKSKSIYERVEVCISEEKQEERGNEIKQMINHYEKLCNNLIDKGEVVHIYIVLRQEKKYCGMRSFIEKRIFNSSGTEEFTRDVEIVSYNGTTKEDADKINMPNEVLPMALKTLLDTLKLIETNTNLEKYRGKKCYWVHIKHPMAAIYFTREINYMEFFEYNSKSGGELKFADTIEKINNQLNVSESVLKGDVDFYKQENCIDNNALAFYEEKYAFVPDPDWLKKTKETRKYDSTSLIGTDLASLRNNKQKKRLITESTVTDKQMPKKRHRK